MRAFFWVCLLIAGVCLAAALIPPGSACLPECYLYRHTGYLCSACGCTRALRALMQGEVLRSFQLNLLLLPTLIWLLALSLAKGRAFSRLLWGGGIVVLLFGVVRNLPCDWADCLRP